MKKCKRCSCSVVLVRAINGGLNPNLRACPWLPPKTLYGTRSCKGQLFPDLGGHTATLRGFVNKCGTGTEWKLKTTNVHFGAASEHLKTRKGESSTALSPQTRDQILKKEKSRMCKDLRRMQWCFCCSAAWRRPDGG